MQNKTYTVDEALKKLQRYCAYQERCHVEVRKKLQEMNMIPDAVDHIIVQLIRHDFLNESRFAKTFVQGKFNQKKWGRIRLRQELKKRAISRTILDKALEEISDEEYMNSFDELALKRLNQIKERNTYKKKKKLADYLLYRGWESHLVYDKVNQLIK